MLVRRNQHLRLSTPVVLRGHTICGVRQLSRNPLQVEILRQPINGGRVTRRWRDAEELGILSQLKEAINAQKEGAVAM